MSFVLRLIARITRWAAPLVLVDAVNPGVRVETAAFAVSFGSEMRVFVNRPSAGDAAQLRVSSGHKVHALPAVPIVLAGAAHCGEGLIVTGSDRAGKPVAMGLSLDGTARWRTVLSGTPIRWPVPGCAPNPIILWMDAERQLSYAPIGATGLGAIRTLAVGGGQLGIATNGGRAWVVWPELEGVRGIEIGTQGTRAIHAVAHRPIEATVGASGNDWYVAWTDGRAGWLARGAAGGELGPATPLELGAAAGGRVAIVAGRSPLVRAQRYSAEEGEPRGWNTALAAPGEKPLLLDRAVFAAAWLGDDVVTVESDAIRFFRFQRKK